MNEREAAGGYSAVWDLIAELKKYGKMFTDSGEMLDGLMEKPSVLPGAEALVISKDQAKNCWRIEKFGCDPLIIKSIKDVLKILDDALHKLATE